MSNDSLGAVLDGIQRFQDKYPSLLKHREVLSAPIDLVLAALNEFMECVRYLNTRRSSGTILNLTDEAAVQDALYLMLRPWIHDLVPENPTDKIGNRYSIKDFLSRSLRLVIEAKFVRNPDHGKSLVKELNDDIETYRYHPACDQIIFFIYDPDACIPDATSLIRHASEPRQYGDKILKCFAVIKP